MWLIKININIGRFTEERYLESKETERSERLLIWLGWYCSAFLVLSLFIF